MKTLLMSVALIFRVLVGGVLIVAACSRTVPFPISKKSRAFRVLCQRESSFANP